MFFTDAESHRHEGETQLALVDLFASLVVFVREALTSHFGSDEHTTLLVKAVHNLRAQGMRFEYILSHREPDSFLQSERLVMVTACVARDNDGELKLCEDQGGIEELSGVVKQLLQAQNYEGLTIADVYSHLSSPEDWSKALGLTDQDWASGRLFRQKDSPLQLAINLNKGYPALLTIDAHVEPAEIKRSLQGAMCRLIPNSVYVRRDPQSGDDQFVFGQDELVAVSANAAASGAGGGGGCLPPLPKPLKSTKPKPKPTPSPKPHPTLDVKTAVQVLTGKMSE